MLIVQETTNKALSNETFIGLSIVDIYGVAPDLHSRRL